MNKSSHQYFRPRDHLAHRRSANMMVASPFITHTTASSVTARLSCGSAANCSGVRGGGKSNVASRRAGAGWTIMIGSLPNCNEVDCPGSP